MLPSLLEFLHTSPRDVKIGIFTHDNADVDAVMSCYVMREFLKHVGFTRVSIFIASASADAKRVMAALNLEVPVGSEPEPVDVAFLLDLNAIDRVPERYREVVRTAHRIFVIDHHHVERMEKGVTYLCLPLSSTCEVLLHLIRAAGAEELLMRDDVARSLLLGIYADTVMLKHAGASTLKVVSEVSGATGVRVPMSLLRREKDVSERIAVLRAMSRTAYVRVDDLIVAATYVGSFESSAATALLRAGADIAVVLSEKREKGKRFYRVILRTRRDMNLAEIAAKLARELGGIGGGHAKAAALEVPAVLDARDLLRKTLNTLCELLKAQVGKHGVHGA